MHVPVRKGLHETRTDENSVVIKITHSFEYQARLIQKLTLGLESVNWQDYKIRYQNRTISVNLLYDNDGGDNGLPLLSLIVEINWV